MQKLNYSKKKQNYAVSACKSDFLAFEQYSCYKPPVFNLISLFDMSAFGRLTGTFSSLAAATMLFATPACAQETPDSTNHAAVTQIAVAANSNGSTVTLVESANYEASRWVVDHQDRLAVSVSLGADSRVPTDVMERILREDFSAQGVDNVEFFYEFRGPGGTVVRYHSDIFVSDAYGLDTAREQVAGMAQRMRFDQQVAFANSPS